MNKRPANKKMYTHYSTDVRAVMVSNGLVANGYTTKLLFLNITAAKGDDASVSP